MPLVLDWATNKGVVREENQDCCFANAFENAVISSAIAVMCDGMGGLEDGAVASKTVCDAVSEWYDLNFCKNKRVATLSEKDILDQLTELLHYSNGILVNYGTKKRVRAGTTASILLIVNNRYYAVHVGDSRIYQQSSALVQITDDDSVAGEKFREGKISREEYDNSNEKNILTQCVGVNSKLNVHTYSGPVSIGDVFFLCSDGMYHNLSNEELKNILTAQRRERGNQISMSIDKLIDKMISRGEKDNLSGIIVCSV